MTGRCTCEPSYGFVCAFCEGAEVRTLRQQVASLTEERDRLKADGWCDACCGTGKVTFGECMCSGTGLASMAVTHLRVRLLKAEADNAKLREDVCRLRGSLEAADHDPRSLKGD